MANKFQQQTNSSSKTEAATTKFQQKIPVRKAQINNMRASKKAAVLMVLLVISMPIYSAAVLGQLSNVQARGLDSINGYIREQDAVTFNAVASISSDADITKNQVLLGSATKPFDS